MLFTPSWHIPSEGSRPKSHVRSYASVYNAFDVPRLRGRLDVKNTILYFIRLKCQ